MEKVIDLLLKCFFCRCPAALGTNLVLIPLTSLKRVTPVSVTSNYVRRGSRNSFIDTGDIFHHSSCACQSFAKLQTFDANNLRPWHYPLTSFPLTQRLPRLHSLSLRPNTVISLRSVSSSLNSCECCSCLLMSSSSMHCYWLRR